MLKDFFLLLRSAYSCRVNNFIFMIIIFSQMLKNYFQHTFYLLLQDIPIWMGDSAEEYLLNINKVRIKQTICYF
jgi:hypothetical protein